MSDSRVTVIGAGLAGSEAAWQLAERGIPVTLREMKPEKMTPAHKSPDFAELVCSNSLRGAGLENAVGLLKEELRQLGSLILAAADATRVPAGGALAVDRQGFSRYVTERIRAHPLIDVVPGEVTAIPEGAVIVATGPLTSDGLAAALGELIGAGNTLNFGLNLLGCYVHDLRLQCLEFFGKFYEDGGRPFQPLDLKAQYYDIVK